MSYGGTVPYPRFQRSILVTRERKSLNYTKCQASKVETIEKMVDQPFSSRFPRISLCFPVTAVVDKVETVVCPGYCLYSANTARRSGSLPANSMTVVGDLVWAVNRDHRSPCNRAVKSTTVSLRRRTFGCHRENRVWGMVSGLEQLNDYSKE